MQEDTRILHFQPVGFSHGKLMRDQHSDQESERVQFPAHAPPPSPCPREYPSSWLVTPHINCDCFLTLCKWNHSILTNLWLAIFLSTTFVKFICVVSCTCSSLFYHSLSPFPSLYNECITLYLFYYWWTFGFFQFGTVMNFSAINIFFFTYFFFWLVNILF